MDSSGVPVNNRNTIPIPIEIIDEILDYLRSDELSLQSCALVSKSWAPSCRKYIFGRLNFDNPLDFATWSRSVSTAPSGPHHYTRELTITNHYLEKERYRSPEYPTVFLQHFRLFCNVQDLTIECSGSQQTIDNTSMSHVFGHLFGALRSLSIHGAACSPQALISFVASFQQLERLYLHGIWFEPSDIPHPLPETHTFKGEFFLADWDDSSEEFIGILAQYDLQYREMSINGECWLQDTTWNRCLTKVSSHLEKFGIHWSESDGFQTTQFKMLAFENLQELLMQSSSEYTTILPPPEFLSSITSTRLSRIVIDTTVFPPGKELDEALDAIKDYDEALCQLANQLDPSSSGSEKLILTLGVVEELADPAAFLPRFSRLGILQIEAAGM